ncbi:hypothetical protein X751_31660 [Mesorhizobium sp. LNJC395A00]|nr:hypothetical protein X751_31660 [Mesorhizobium sp. LNJC395A00]
MESAPEDWIIRARLCGAERPDPRFELDVFEVNRILNAWPLQLHDPIRMRIFDPGIFAVKFSSLFERRQSRRTTQHCASFSEIEGHASRGCVEALDLDNT